MLFGRRQAQSSSGRPPFRRELADRSRTLRTAPGYERGTRPEVRADVRYGHESLHRGADEEPLIRTLPVEQEPAPVGRPDDAPETPRAAEDRARRASEHARELQRAARTACLDEGVVLSVRRDRGCYDSRGSPIESADAGSALPE